MQQRAELVGLLVAEHDARIEAIGHSTETSAAGRKQYADVTTAHLRSEVIKLQAEIAQSEELRNYLTLAINHDALPTIPRLPAKFIPFTPTT